ncbi:MAG: transglutaminase-like cysteine peptidase [Magnetococcales bacterium]|nr:transglutaminase-like cysteine peptidase [Magnetococcales bacterium]
MKQPRAAWPMRKTALLLLCGLGLLPLQAMANREGGDEWVDRLTPVLFRDSQQPERDTSGRTERLRRLIERHEQHRPVGWTEQIRALQALPPLEQLRAAHAYVNRRLTYVDHAETWKSPQEAFASGGVCVEYATTKMVLLRDAGFPESALRVVTLRPLKPNGVFHVVLLARLPDGAVFVLDSPDRAQSASIVPLALYRERIRPVVWAGWRGGFSTNDHPPVGGVDAFSSARTGVPQERTSRFASGDRLVDIAAELRVVRPGERPLTEAERHRLALLRRYYRAPTAENRHLLTAAEVKKLEGIRARLDREEGLYAQPRVVQRNGLSGR